MEDTIEVKVVRSFPSTHENSIVSSAQGKLRKADTGGVILIPQKSINDKEKQSRAGNWDGLGNEPRNENLFKIPLGSFEKKEITERKEKQQA